MGSLASAAVPAPERGVSDGFPPSAWGPSLWLFIHLVAASYPERPTAEQRARYAALLASLPHTLPCEGCRRGMLALTAEPGAPLRLCARALESRASLFAWTVRLHNAVNRKLGKPVREDAAEWYAHYDALRRPSSWPFGWLVS